MVGTLALPERILVAKVILALARRDEAGRREVARLYAEAGYRAVTHSGTPHPPAVVARIACFHLDRIDLSPVDVATPINTPSPTPTPTPTPTSTSTSTPDEEGKDEARTRMSAGADVDVDVDVNVPVHEPEMKHMVSVLQGTVEVSVPDWIEQSRRLGGLLIGVGSQMGRPISLAKEWEPIARQLLEEHGQL
jgi:hypothetical protein